MFVLLIVVNLGEVMSENHSSVPFETDGYRSVDVVEELHQNVHMIIGQVIKN